MRLYSFCNMYFGGQQAGVQCQHATVELMRQYYSDSLLVKTWADDHKTTILLNGGDYNKLCELIGIISNTEYPYAWFKETSVSNAPVLSNVCVVVPSKIYEYKRLFDEWGGYTDDETGITYIDTQFESMLYSPHEILLAETIASKRLMV